MSYLKERDKAQDKNYGNILIKYRSSISVLKSISLRSTHCAIKATYMHANRGVGFRREPFLICVLLSKVIFISKLDKCPFLKGNSNGISSLRNHFVSRQSSSEHLKENSKKLGKISVIKNLFQGSYLSINSSIGIYHGGLVMCQLWLMAQKDELIQATNLGLGSNLHILSLFLDPISLRCYNVELC